MGVSSWDRDSTKVKGSDDTEIGNVGDRLKVDAVFNVGSAPPDDIQYFKRYLLNGSSSDMTVDGSTTPVTFKLAVTATETWFVDQIIFTILDAGNNDPEKFGAVSVLTNGLDFNFKIDGITHLYRNVKDNGDVASTFRDQFMGSAAGYMHNGNFYVGFEEFKDEVTVRAGNSDEVQVVVNDDLTGIDRLQVSIRYWKKI
jgi:hypothetical protein